LLTSIMRRVGNFWRSAAIISTPVSGSAVELAVEQNQINPIADGGEQGLVIFGQGDHGIRRDRLDGPAKISGIRSTVADEQNFPGRAHAGMIGEGTEKVDRG
jgi:hypothetical protein